jgi:hypothetical protein
MGQPRRPADRIGSTGVAKLDTADDLLHIWLEGEPGVTAADYTIPDLTGERDLDLIASAVVAGLFGRILPVRLHYADRPSPNPGQWRSIDTARFLRDYSIRHRRRYEVLLDAFEGEADKV